MAKEQKVVKARLYRAVPLEDGEYVQYVGVYVLKWRAEWGKPTIGFVEAGFVELEYEEEIDGRTAV